ncbi:MAG: hypothetical protein JNL74_04350, partial [Fibrobacteres bacterium]|nr:hypothetical protein [Fibrobacterota bacterium]
MTKKLLPLLLLWTAAIFGARTHDEILYVPNNLQNNVKFWISVYSTLETDRGIIHDIDSV